MKRRWLRRMLILSALGSGLTSPGHGRTDEFPTKTVELVIPIGPGGAHDRPARAMVSVAQPYLGRPLVVVLKPGGGGAVGSQYVARAKPDGHTLLLGGT